MHPEAKQDYRIRMVVKAGAENVFEALTSSIDGWWGPIDRIPAGLGDQFTVSWGPAFYQFKIVKWEPPNFINWFCIDANQIILDLKGVEREWVGNQLIWSILPKGPRGIEVGLIHQGLLPDCICYDFCAASWDRYIGERLKGYLEEG